MSIPPNSQNIELDTKRHSFAHVMAAAVGKMFPEAQFGVGPVIDNGCFYDLKLPRTLIPEDLPLLEQEVKNLLARNLVIKRQVMSLDEAVTYFTQMDQPLKVELLHDLATKGTTSFTQEEQRDIAPVSDSEVPEITVYRLEDDDTGEDLFVDLCQGPHVEHVSELRDLGYQLDKFSGAYWRGDQERNIQMQRVYALVFEDTSALDEYLEQRKLAQERDHRKLGSEMDLFMTHEEIGAGLPVFLPKGAKLRQLLEDYMRQVQEQYGYQYVYTPHIGKKDLFARSGHLDHYAENMYAPIDMVNLHGEGRVNGQADQFYLKPMNCPMHHHVYLHKPRSYRELPFKIMEYGTVYRYEESGVLSGLIRVRGFTQNDAHVYCRYEQIKDVVGESIQTFQNVYHELGITDYSFRFSLPDFDNDEEKFGQETEQWRLAIQYLKQALDESGVNYYEAKGEAAFYGPKIDVQMKNVNGKEDTLSTIQVDFNIAPQFGITYIDEEGHEQTPAIMHRALMGSIERFMAFLIESCGGRFPFWLAPEQVRIVTVNNQEETVNYVKRIQSLLNEVVLMHPLKYNELRHTLDESNQSLGKKIRQATVEKVPLILIVGPRDMAEGKVSVRTQEQETAIDLNQLEAYIKDI